MIARAKSAAAVDDGPRDSVTCQQRPLTTEG